MTRETVDFVIGEETVPVPSLVWASLEDVVLPLMEASRLKLPNGENALPWWSTRGNDIKIVAEGVRRTRPDLTLSEIRERLNLQQALDLTVQLVELLKISGFSVKDNEPGELEAASPSTETSVDSSPT